jgi:hypothetical protein
MRRSRLKEVLSLFGWVDQTVADAGLGQQVARPDRIRLELAAQVRDVNVQVVGLVCARRAPDLAQDR